MRPLAIVDVSCLLAMRFHSQFSLSLFAGNQTQFSASSSSACVYDLFDSKQNYKLEISLSASEEVTKVSIIDPFSTPFHFSLGLSLCNCGDCVRQGPARLRLSRMSVIKNKTTKCAKAIRSREICYFRTNKTPILQIEFSSQLTLVHYPIARDLNFLANTQNMDYRSKKKL